MTDYPIEGPTNRPSSANPALSRTDLRLRAEAELALLNRAQNGESFASIARRLSGSP